MNLPTNQIEPFFVELKGNNYPCTFFERKGEVLYVVKFSKTHLFLAQANAQNGTRFWTSIPEDTKINHIVQELGRQIEDHLKKTICAITTEEE